MINNNLDKSTFNKTLQKMIESYRVSKEQKEELKAIFLSSVIKAIFLSSVTDPYNAFESKYKLTRSILEQLVDVDCTLYISTKSNLLIMTFLLHLL